MNGLEILGWALLTVVIVIIAFLLVVALQGYHAPPMSHCYEGCTLIRFEGTKPIYDCLLKCEVK